MTPERPRTLPLLPLVLLWIGTALAPSTPPAHAQEVPEPAVPLAVASYSPVPVSFGFVSVGRTPPTALISVRNLGSADLVISSIVPDNPAFTVEQTSLAPIPAGGSASFRITFEPVETGTHEAAIVIQSNDAFNPTFSLPVKGRAVDVTVTITPQDWLLTASQHAVFTADVTGTPDTSITWSVEGDGTIDQDGIYTAPAAPGSAVIRATSTIDPEASGTANVLILAPDLTEPPDTSLAKGRFGSQVEAVDLDQNGLVEVVATAPEAEVTTGSGPVAGAGTVWIRTFGPQGFQGATTLLTSPDPVGGGGFGETMVIADLNGDGRSDVAVGEPGGTGALAGSGAVHVFFGDGAGGFDPAVTVAPADGAAGDRFGAALAVGYFTGGAPPQLAVGAPGREVAGQPGAGRVEVVDLATGTPVFPLAAPLTAPEPGAGAGFGAALAAACLNGCTAYGLVEEAVQKNDLVVGAPGADVDVNGATLAGAGRVFAFLAAGTPTDPAFGPAAEVSAPLPTPGAAFGQAIAAGDLTQSVLHDLVIGAPGQPTSVGDTNISAGMAFVFVTDGLGGYLPFTHLQDPEPQPDGRFGASLRLKDVDRDDLLDLTVGAPAGAEPGRLLTYYGTGEGDFGGLRRFRASAPAPADGYGQGAVWRDLNADGIPDLVVGAPGTKQDGVSDAGALEIHLERPPSPVTITPQRHMLARNGGRGNKIRLNGSVSPDFAVWSVPEGRGTISSAGLYIAPTTSGNRLENDVTVMLQDPDDDAHWALARILLTNRVANLDNPEVTTGSQGELLLGLPEAGAHFGSDVAIANLGRNITDPYRPLASVLGSFPALNSTLFPRVPRFPYDDDIGAPFTSIQLYFGRSEDIRSGWGMQLVTGDFDGDGNQDVAVSAPFAPSADSSEVQVGFVDVIELDDQGAPKLGLIRISPSRSMLAPDGSTLWVGSDARSNTRYGYRLLVHDLNGDGRDDLIVGMPHADLAGVRDAGLVEVILAPDSGDWTQSLIRATLGAPNPRSGGYFGSALAVGDLTGDGLPELFVGAPGRDPEGLETLLKGEGLVHVFSPASWSHATGESLRGALNTAPHLTVTDPTPPPSGYYSGFGMALHVANLLVDDDADELVVGAPMRIISDPVSRDFLDVPRKREIGGVDLFDGNGGLGVQLAAQLAPPLRQVGMRFGGQLTTGRLAGPDGPLFLVVGVPYYDSPAGPNAGSVVLFEPGTNGLPRYRTTLTAPDAGDLDQFGEALVTGDVDGDGGDELVVGAPNVSIDVQTGVRIYPSRFRGPEPIIDHREHAGRVYVIFPGLL